MAWIVTMAWIVAWLVLGGLLHYSGLPIHKAAGLWAVALILICVGALFKWNREKDGVITKQAEEISWLRRQLTGDGEQVAKTTDGI
jgi:hypothetical protein